MTESVEVGRGPTGTVVGKEGTKELVGRAPERLRAMEESSASMEEATSEGMENGKTVGLKVGIGRAVMDSG